MGTTVETQTAPTLQTLPGDAVRQIMWRFAERFELQMIIQSTRGVARGPVARLVAEGGRNTHEWTEGKDQLFKHYDEGGITSTFLEPEFGGIVQGPKNLALSLVAWELAWVDGGAATSSLASNLAYAPIWERGTKEQRDEYMAKQVPLQPGENRRQYRGAFALTEPLPYVGVDAGALGGRISVAKWEEGEEPILQVEKRGRFITNMDVAGYVTAAVDTGDDRVASSCMVILEDTDPGTFDRGAPTLKLVHQLSSTRDPVFSVQVPASRIIGGYTMQDGKVVPNYNHGEVLEAVFRHTRIAVGLMSSAKLLSAIEPVLRYQRQRSRGGGSEPGTPRYELGLQQKEDARHRLIDIWATGEAGASLGFETSRKFDVVDPLERRKDEILAEQGVVGGRAQMRAMRKIEKEALELLLLREQPEAERDNARLAELEANELVQFVVEDAVANVLCPACKLWNTGYGATMMREAVSLMGGYGITEDCPGFLAQKWMDAQLEATYEGPECVQRRQLGMTMISPVFLAQFKQWTNELRQIGPHHAGTGACGLAEAMELWMWTVDHMRTNRDADGGRLYNSPRQGVIFPLADALCWLVATRQMILDVLELGAKGPANPMVAEGLEGIMAFYTDLCHVQVARSIGEVGRICAELVHGYNSKPDECDAGGNCCVVDCNDRGEFNVLRNRLDGCLSGSRLAKDRAADALMDVMIPEALDYPQ